MSVDGTYEININSPMGNLTGLLTLKEESGSLSGKIESKLGKGEFSGGKVDGNRAVYDVQLNSPMGKVTLSCNAVVDEKGINGEVKAGNFGTFPFSGQKV